MLTFVEGDLFTSPAQVLVNTVNTVGVMGKGIAKEFKAIYPDMFREYQALCERGELTVGRLFLYRTPHKSVLNFPTKRSWRQRSRLADIEAGLETFVESYQAYGIVSIAFPQLGCGNGELDWESQVRPVMERYLSNLPIEVYIHIYLDQSLLPEHRDRSAMQSWLQSDPRSLPFDEFWHDLGALTRTDNGLGWRVNETEDGVPMGLIGNATDSQAAIEREDLFDLWYRLRSFGYVSISDLQFEQQFFGDRLFDLLEQLPYVRRTRFLATADLADRRKKPLRDALLEDAPRAIRIVPASGQTVHLPRLPLMNVDGVDQWGESTTTRQSRLSLMS